MQKLQRLLNLEKDELEALAAGKITAGHARALLSAQGENRRAMFAAALAGASVRELEKAAKRGETQKTAAPKSKVINKFYSEVELALKEELGRKVYIKPTGKHSGTITLEFYSDEELSELAKNLSKGKG